MTKKKSTFQTIAEAMVFEKLGNMKLSTNHMNKRKLSIDEIKVLIRESFKDAKKSCDVSAKTAEGGWGSADTEKEIDWIKKLEIKEFFNLAESDADLYDDDDPESPIRKANKRPVADPEDKMLPGYDKDVTDED